MSNDDDLGNSPESVYVFSKTNLTFSFAGGLKVKLRITNNAPWDVTNVSWDMQVVGGIFGFISITKNETLMSPQVNQKPLVPVVSLGLGLSRLLEGLQVIKRQ